MPPLHLAVNSWTTGAASAGPYLGTGVFSGTPCSFCAVSAFFTNATSRPKCSVSTSSTYMAVHVLTCSCGVRDKSTMWYRPLPRIP